MHKLYHLYLIVLLITVIQKHADGRLTQNGLPTGQTVAPTGREYLLNAPLRSGSAPRSKKAKRATRPRQRYYMTPSTNHPFLTLRDGACVNSTPLAVRDDEGLVGVVRSVSAKQLSGMITGSAHSGKGRREMTIILFHGGVECEWSRKFWRVWTEFSRRMRRVCVVAIDGAADSMMNYNLMVLGFPTVMRVTGERNSDTFRGNRTVNELVEWAVHVGGGPPLEMEGWDGLTGDLKWLEIEEKDIIGGQVKVLDVSEAAARQSRRVNWALLGANIISTVNIGYVLWRGGIRWIRGKAEADGNSEGERAQQN